MAAQHPWTALVAPGICTLVCSYLFAQVGVWQSGVGFMGLVILALLVLVKREDGRSDGFTLGGWPWRCSPYSAAMKNSLLVKDVNSILSGSSLWTL